MSMSRHGHLDPVSRHGPRCVSRNGSRSMSRHTSRCPCLDMDLDVGPCLDTDVGHLDPCLDTHLGLDIVLCVSHI